MADIILKNQNMEIGINYHGAELKSLKKNGTEYLWCGDPAFWNRSSPVLFPFVGGVKDGVYRHEGKEYRIGQHGFARDRDFEVVSRTEDTIWFGLSDDEESRKIYPFGFCLGIGYQLLDDGVKVMWKVTNYGDSTMYYAIGAHPAFYCPIKEGEKQTDCSLLFEKKDGTAVTKLTNRIFGQGGTVTDRCETIETEEGYLPITDTLFDNDAKVLENGQVQRVSLVDGEKNAYLTVEFDSPLVGIWSSPKKHAPFICIEPWYGRCDSESFAGELKDRDWEQSLEPGESFEAEYRIITG